MKHNLMITLIFASIFFVSCEKDMKWINAGDPQADSAEIAKICEEQEAECGEVYIKQYDGNYHPVFCGKCAENYNCEDNKCLGKKRFADCDPKPENSAWNDNNAEGAFVQTWNGAEWVPATHEAVFSKNPDECAFQCYAGFYWNNDLCEREPTRNAYCYGLPENAEWNSVSEITQTWNGEEYAPPIEGTFNEEASTTECRFKCISEAEWTGSRCKLIPECSPTSATPCKDSSSGLIWSAKESSGMTWENAIDYCKTYSEDGLSGWHLPTISELRTLIQNCPKTETGGSCGVTDSCLSSSECDNAACVGCGGNVVDSNPSKYSKLGDDTGYFGSSSVLSDRSDSVWFVNFSYGGYLTHFGKDSGTLVRCVRSNSNSDTDTDDTDVDADTDTDTTPATSCDPNPCSNIANSDGICTEHGIADYSCGCNEHYNWNSSTLKCEPETQTFYCADKPENSSWNSVSSYTQTWDGTGWIPATSTTSYNETASSTECRFKCNSGYEWDGTKCKLKELPECSSESAIPCKDSSTSLMWSSANTSGKDWDSAVDYCSNLNEEGYHDWHLPTIDELRTLIQNCPNTETGGPCKVTNSCLSSSCRNDDYCNGCGVHNDGSLSKLGNSDLPSYGDPRFWSSSVNSGNTNSAWEIVFSHANINSYSKTEKKYVRCVRKY